MHEDCTLSADPRLPPIRYQQCFTVRRGPSRYTSIRKENPLSDGSVWQSSQAISGELAAERDVQDIGTL